jgi:hypothetical protein
MCLHYHRHTTMSKREKMLCDQCSALGEIEIDARPGGALGFFSPDAGHHYQAMPPHRL